MIERIEKWLAAIVRRELQAAIAEMKSHIETKSAEVKNHVSAIAQTTVRRACSSCGQMTYKYVNDDVTGKTKCLDCAAKGKS